MMAETNLGRGHVTTWLLSVLMIAAMAAQTARIMSTRSATGETPFHSANDRSRWCSVAAIGGFGQFEIDPFLEIRDPRTKRRTWATIDLVRHRGRDGRQHYYSSKPPLLSVIHAGVYAALRMATGLSLITQTFTTARVILVIVNLLPLAWLWWLWGRYWQRRGINEWAYLVISIFTFSGTFVSTFANTLNNHLPGAVAAGISLWAILKIVEDGRRELKWFVTAGAAAAFCSACELPALSWVAAVTVLLVQVAPRRAAVGLAIGILPIAIAFAAVNVMAHGDLRPPYAHRAAGELVTTMPRPAHDPSTPSLDAHRTAIIQAVRDKGHDVSNSAVVRSTRTAGVQELWDESTQRRFALVADSDSIHIHHWDDWYDYPNSYWYPDRKQGVDRGEPSRLNYVFQSTFGHHGVLSLTPMWLLLPWGMWIVWAKASGSLSARLFDYPTQVMLAIAATSIVCFGFYMLRPLEDRNYGGVTSGFRWMFWFTPLWCWLIGHALEKISSRWMRRAVLLALAVSIFSATFPWANPWTTPWPAQWLQAVR